MSTWKIHPEIDHYFCTNTISEWYPIFTDKIYFDVIIQSLKHCKNEKGMLLHGYVIMINHIHLIVSSTSNLSVSEIMRDFKRYTAKRITSIAKKRGDYLALNVFRIATQKKGLKQKYKVWQIGFHPISIYSEQFYRNKLEYIHLNPVRKGYVLEPHYWFYSSAGNYLGKDHTALKIDFLE